MRYLLILNPTADYEKSNTFQHLLFLLLFLGFQNLNAQPQTIFYRAWSRTSASLQPDFLNHVVTTVNSSSETYVAGSTLNASNTYSMILSKYSATGTLSWSVTFDVNTAGNVHVGAIALDASGNILVTGSAYNGSTNNYDLFVVKYNSSGTKQWHQLHNGPGNAYDFGSAAICASNGDVFVTGGAFQTALNVDAVTIRYNSSGTAQWTKTWDNEGYTDACGTIALNNGAVVVTGFSQTNATTWEYAALRYDQSTGNSLSTYVTSQGGTTIEFVNAAAFDNFGNIYITGAMSASGQGLNIKTIKLSSTLGIVWTATWNGASNEDDAGRGIVVDASGNVYVAGYTMSGDRDGVMLKYNSGGSLSWSNIYDATGGDDEYADLGLTSSGEPFAGGYATQKGNKDFYAVFYSSSGSVRWSEAHNGLYNKDDAIQQVVPDGAGNFLVAGPSGQDGGSQAVMTVKYALHTLVKPQDEEVNTPFVENLGQTLDTDGDPADDIRYYTRSMYPNVFISDDKVSYVYAHIDTVPSSADTMVRIDLSFPPTSTQTQNGRTQVAVGLERQDAFHNYYLGHIPEGRERAPLENKVLQPSIYDNIDALYGQGQDGLFIRFICKPGCNPADIKLYFSGQTALSVLSDGSLKIETALEDLVLPKPTAMTVSEEGTETAITAWQPSYSISSGVVSISTGSYDGAKTLVLKIGREREEGNADENYWSTYYGDTDEDEVISLDADKNGDIYFTGTTESVFFPTLNAIQDQLHKNRDAFAGKFNYQGIRLWATYYGGNKSSASPLGSFSATEIELGLDVVVGKDNPNIANGIDNSIYFVGRTDGLDFPLKQNASAYFDDIFWPSPNNYSHRGFIVKLTKALGFVQWATFFGDAGSTQSGNYPLVQEGITVGRLNNNGGLCIGGIVKKTSDNWESTFPAYAPNGQYSQSYGTAFIAEFDASDALTWATKLTCEGSQSGPHDIAFDSENHVYFVGQSNPGNFCLNTWPTTAPPGGYLQTPPTNGKVDGWIMKFDAGREMTWSTFFGGANDDQLNSAVVDVNDNLIVVGSSLSTDLPVQSLNSGEYFDGSYNGGSDIFIAMFSKSGSKLYTTYFGGSGEEYYDNATAAGPYSHDGGCAVFLGTDLIITGPTKSVDFPVYNVVTGNIYYHPQINKNFNTTSEDAFLLILDENFKRTFCTYWGGEKDDESHEIAAASANNQSFVVIGGESRSNSTIFERRIPLSQETPLTYYQPDYGGGSIDGFVSKIRLEELTSSAKEVMANVVFSIVPNPVSSSITVQLLQGSDSQGCAVLLFDVTGRQLPVPVTQLNDQTWFVELESLPSGNYLISIVAEHFVSSQLVVKF